MKRSYYAAYVDEFLRADKHYILGLMTKAHSFALDELQRNAWMKQIQFMQCSFKTFHDGYLLFEYAIPRMGKRIDNVLIYKHMVFAIEFKVGQRKYHRHAINQVFDYALDLKYFHSVSHSLPITPVLVATQADPIDNSFTYYDDQVLDPLLACEANLIEIIENALELTSGSPIDPFVWEASEYRPTPTIIEAAQALYKGHHVRDISRSDAGAINLGNTSECISEIIEHSKIWKEKAICFLTGVPGAGKTLAGLNIANQRQKIHQDEHAVFLSGNGPLVTVLQEALARDDVENSNESVTKREALAKTKVFIQNIHHFRDDAIVDLNPPREKVVIFDEAQRAWTQEKTSDFMVRRKSIPDFQKSEPEFLIEVLDRHTDWAVIICLIGGGQEINTGEAGLPEWFKVLGKKFRNWHVYVSETLDAYEYTQGQDLFGQINPTNLYKDPRLHLSTSTRSFRSERVSELIKFILDIDLEHARELCQMVKESYPIYITRDLSIAKKWVKEQARGSERYGIIASSGAYRLRPFGIVVKAQIDPSNWFLNPEWDVRSSYYLEDVATEFDIQGLELDWTVLAWGGDLRLVSGQWEYRSFRGTRWQNVNSDQRRLYLKNAYRVLLTRARQGMIIFVPPGDEVDVTRMPEFYDGTYAFLQSIGLLEI